MDPLHLVALTLVLCDECSHDWDQAFSTCAGGFDAVNALPDRARLFVLLADHSISALRAVPTNAIRADILALRAAGFLMYVISNREHRVAVLPIVLRFISCSC